MIPIGLADGHEAAGAVHDARLREAGPTVTATNTNPIRVAAAVPAKIKKLSHPWNIIKQCSPSAAFVYDDCANRKCSFISGIITDNALVSTEGTWP